MQIEFIGCTSAGKSTLARSILQSCREQGLDIFLGDDFVLRQARLNWIKGHLPRSALINLLGLLACLVTWRTHLEFYRFATKLLFKLPIARLEKLNLLRNVLKKIGIYEIIRFRDTDRQVILVDEGVLQIAHNLFVHGSVQVKEEHIATFTRLIPFPDVIVYIRQPESLLIDRIMMRGHKRIPDCSYSNVAPFVERAVATFDQLVQYPEVESRLLVVNGGQTISTTANNRNNTSYDLALNVVRKGLIPGVANTRFETAPSL